MRRALVFPGQGSEEAAMGLELAAREPRARRLLALASDACGLDVPRMLERRGRALERTEVIQPVLVAVGLGVAHALAARGIEPACVAGHSLGELTAACVALGIGDEDAIALAAARGRAMGEAAGATPGSMLAVRPAALAGRELPPGVVLAAVNAPDELVLSGERAAIHALARVLGGSVLPVSGAWHSPAMEPALAPFRKALAAHLRAGEPRVELVSAIDGRVVAPTEIGIALASSLVRPVRFAEALGVVSARVDEILVAAPSRIVRSLARRGLGRGHRVIGLDRPEDLDGLLAPR